MLPPYLYRHDTLPYTSAIVLLGIDIATYMYITSRTRGARQRNDDTQCNSIDMLHMTQQCKYDVIQKPEVHNES